MKVIKKPIVVEAFYFNGDLIGKDGKYYVPDWAEQAHKNGVVIFKDGEMYINTLEGIMKANVGDYIMKGINGEIYPIKKEIFEQTYDLCR